MKCEQCGAEIDGAEVTGTAIELWRYVDGAVAVGYVCLNCFTPPPDEVKNERDIQSA